MNNKGCVLGTERGAYTKCCRTDGLLGEDVTIGTLVPEHHVSKEDAWGRKGKTKHKRTFPLITCGLQWPVGQGIFEPEWFKCLVMWRTCFLSCFSPLHSTNFYYVSVLQDSALQLNGVCEEIIALACLEVDMSEEQAHSLASGAFSGGDSTGLFPVPLVHVTCLFVGFLLWADVARLRRFLLEQKACPLLFLSGFLLF